MTLSTTSSGVAWYELNHSATGPEELSIFSLFGRAISKNKGSQAQNETGFD
jgi:hypothetical protein